MKRARKLQPRLTARQYAALVAAADLCSDRYTVAAAKYRQENPGRAADLKRALTTLRSAARAAFDAKGGV